MPGLLPSNLHRKNDRQYPARPLLGVGALIFRRDKILLVQRGKEPLKGYWSLPGGLVETGERLEAAIEREVAEETGLKVRAHYLAEVFQRIMHDAEGRAEYHYVLADYVCRVRKDGPAVPHAGDDAGSVAWVKIEDLGSVLLTEGTKEVVERVYAKHKRRNARI
jgi:ADP-ribose pyrophosphatase YjhB (NUDIX family)